MTNKCQYIKTRTSEFEYNNGKTAFPCIESVNIPKDNQGFCYQKMNIMHLKFLIKGNGYTQDFTAIFAKETISPSGSKLFPLIFL